MTSAATRKEWLTGWPLLASCVFGMSAPTVAHYTIGQFMAPLEAAFGWSRAQVSSGLSLSLLVSMLLAPLIGRTVDRVNVRPIALLGVILTGSCVASFSLATSNLRLWIALWTLHAASASLASPVIWIAVIPSLFRANRSFATAVALAGTSLGALFGPILSQYLIRHFEWRGAFRLLSLSWFSILLLVTTLCFFDRRPRRRSGTPAEPARAPSGDPSLRSVLASRTFVSLAFVIFSVMAMESAYMVHERSSSSYR